MTQTKKQTMVEVTVATTIGYSIAICTQMIIFPIYGLHIGSFHNFQIAAIFTVVSLIRGYIVRRVFNRCFKG